MSSDETIAILGALFGDDIEDVERPARSNPSDRYPPPQHREPARRPVRLFQGWNPADWLVVDRRWLRRQIMPKQ